MDGIHDVGGKPGYGFVDKASTAHPFENPWEGRVFAMLNLVARAGAYQNTDEFRHAIERIAQGEYFDHEGQAATLSVMKNQGLIQSECITAPKFQIDQNIRTISNPLPGHTRLPEFGRNREGTIIDCQGLWTFPDANAHQLDPSQQLRIQCD